MTDLTNPQSLLLIPVAIDISLSLDSFNVREALFVFAGIFFSHAVNLSKMRKNAMKNLRLMQKCVMGCVLFTMTLTFAMGSYFHGKTSTSHLTGPIIVTTPDGSGDGPEPPPPPPGGGQN